MNKIKIFCKDYFLIEEFYCILNKKEFCIFYLKLCIRRKMVVVNFDFIFFFQIVVYDYDYFLLFFIEYWVDEVIKVYVLSS